MPRQFTVALGIVTLLINSSLAFAACKAEFPSHQPGRFVDNADGTVTDSRTGLQWMRCDLGATWNAATSTCASSPESPAVKSGWSQVLQAVNDFNAAGGIAGRADWRLPNVKEMASIVMLNCSPAIDETAFPNSAAQYWTSSPSRKSNTGSTGSFEASAWSVMFGSSRPGRALPEAVSTRYNVKLVRGGSRPQGR